MPKPIPLPLVRLLCNLRWLAVAGQAITVWVATGPMGVALAPAPLWSGVAALASFNLYATWRARAAAELGSREIFAHILVDIVMLAWMVGWSGGVENPFSSLFLLPVALSILALSGRWVWATAMAGILGFMASALLAQPLPHVHGAFGDTFSLHKVGMFVTFAVSMLVVLVFFTRMASAWRESERQVARLQERFTRSEGIIALATHAASVAHELNTPLGTLTLMVEDMAGDPASTTRREDLSTMRTLLEACRDRVRELARPADAGQGGADPRSDLERVIEQWRLVRPTIDLHRTGTSGAADKVDRAVGHLLQALLNNAADASQQAGNSRVDLHMTVDTRGMRASVRDYGAGFGQAPAVLPGTLFRTNKPDGMGIGLALSHATVERLGGTLSMQAAADGPGVVVVFELPAMVAA